MKFVSKTSNLRIILRPGIQANHLTGSEPVPTLYVQFREGMANVDDADLIARMERHPGMNQDFIKVEAAEVDPYAANRAPSEPVHVISNIENGRVVARSAPSVGTPKLPPAIQALIEEKAKSLAIDMVPALLAELTKQAQAEATPETTTSDVTTEDAAAVSEVIHSGDEPSQDIPETKPAPVKGKGKSAK